MSVWQCDTRWALWLYCSEHIAVREERICIVQRKSFSDMPCPIARSLERVGEWWSILILRDAFYGVTRFDEFQKSLDIAPNMLTRRLSGLVTEGLLERRLYCEKPPRSEYHLTPRGRDFRPVLLALMNWGNTHFAPEGRSVFLVDGESGEKADAIFIDSKTGKRISNELHVVEVRPVVKKSIQRRTRPKKTS